MGGIVGRSADHVEQGSGQKISNSVIRIRPLEEKWTEMQPMLEDRSTFSCAVWNGWIWVCGSISGPTHFHLRSSSAPLPVHREFELCYGPNFRNHKIEPTLRLADQKHLVK